MAGFKKFYIGNDLCEYNPGTTTGFSLKYAGKAIPAKSGATLTLSSSDPFEFIKKLEDKTTPAITPVYDFHEADTSTSTVTAKHEIKGKLIRYKDELYVLNTDNEIKKLKVPNSGKSLGFEFEEPTDAERKDVVQKTQLGKWRYENNKWIKSEYKLKKANKEVELIYNATDTKYEVIVGGKRENLALSNNDVVLVPEQLKGEFADSAGNKFKFFTRDNKLVVAEKASGATQYSLQEITTPNTEGNSTKTDISTSVVSATHSFDGVSGTYSKKKITLETFTDPSSTAATKTVELQYDEASKSFFILDNRTTPPTSKKIELEESDFIKKVDGLGDTEYTNGAGNQCKFYTKSGKLFVTKNTVAPPNPANYSLEEITINLRTIPPSLTYTAANPTPHKEKLDASTGNYLSSYQILNLGPGKEIRLEDGKLQYREGANPTKHISPTKKLAKPLALTSGLTKQSGEKVKVFTYNNHLYIAEETGPNNGTYTLKISERNASGLYNDLKDVQDNEIPKSLQFDKNSGELKAKAFVETPTQKKAVSLLELLHYPFDRNNPPPIGGGAPITANQVASDQNFIQYKFEFDKNGNFIGLNRIQSGYSVPSIPQNNPVESVADPAEFDSAKRIYDPVSKKMFYVMQHQMKTGDKHKALFRMEEKHQASDPNPELQKYNPLLGQWVKALDSELDTTEKIAIEIELTKNNRGGRSFSVEYPSIEVTRKANYQKELKQNENLLRNLATITSKEERTDARKPYIQYRNQAYFREPYYMQASNRVAYINEKYRFADIINRKVKAYYDFFTNQESVTNLTVSERIAIEELTETTKKRIKEIENIIKLRDEYVSMYKQYGGDLSVEELTTFFESFRKDIIDSKDSVSKQIFAGSQSKLGPKQRASLHKNINKKLNKKINALNEYIKELEPSYRKLLESQKILESNLIPLFDLTKEERKTQTFYTPLADVIGVGTTLTGESLYKNFGQDINLLINDCYGRFELKKNEKGEIQKDEQGRNIIEFKNNDKTKVIEDFKNGNGSIPTYTKGSFDYITTVKNDGFYFVPEHAQYSQSDPSKKKINDIWIKHALESAMNTSPDGKIYLKGGFQSEEARESIEKMARIAFATFGPENVDTAGTPITFVRRAELEKEYNLKNKNGGLKDEAEIQMRTEIMEATNRSIPSEEMGEKSEAQYKKRKRTVEKDVRERVKKQKDEINGLKDSEDHSGKKFEIKKP